MKENRAAVLLPRDVSQPASRRAMAWRDICERPCAAIHRPIDAQARFGGSESIAAVRRQARRSTKEFVQATRSKLQPIVHCENRTRPGLARRLPERQSGPSAITDRRPRGCLQSRGTPCEADPGSTARTIRALARHRLSLRGSHTRVPHVHSRRQARRTRRRTDDGLPQSLGETVSESRLRECRRGDTCRSHRGMMERRRVPFGYGGVLFPDSVT